MAMFTADWQYPKLAPGGMDGRRLLRAKPAGNARHCQCNRGNVRRFKALWLLLPVAAVLAPPLASAQTMPYTVVVSNLGETQSVIRQVYGRILAPDVGVDRAAVQRAASFTVGTAGAVIAGVTLPMCKAGNQLRDLTVAIHADDNGSPAANPLDGGRLTGANPATECGAVNFYTFTSAAGVVVTPGTTYWVVVAHPADHPVGILNDRYNWSHTNSGNETSSAGWSIGGTKVKTGTGNWTSATGSARFSVLAARELSFGGQTVLDRIFYPGDDVSETLPRATGGIGDISYTLAPVSAPRIITDNITFDPATRVLSGVLTSIPNMQVLSYVYTAMDASGNTPNPTLRFTLVWAPTTVDNISESQAARTTDLSFLHLSGFTTGANPGGYLVREARFFTGQPTQERAVIVAAGNNGPAVPFAPFIIGTIGRSGSTGEEVVYGSLGSTSITLRPNTSYYLGVYRTRLRTTQSTNQRSPGGWDIVNGLWCYGCSGGSNNTRTLVSANHTLRFAFHADSVASFDGQTIPGLFFSNRTEVSLQLPQAAGGAGSLSYSLSPGTLPAGLSFDAGDRLIYGTPVTSSLLSAFTYTYTAEDIADLDQSATPNPSLTFTIKTSSKPFAAAPGDVAAAPRFHGQLVVSWGRAPAVPGVMITGYRVLATSNTAREGFAQCAQVGASAREATCDNLAGGVRHWVRVEAVASGDNQSIPSAPVAATPRAFYLGYLAGADGVAGNRVVARVSRGGRRTLAVAMNRSPLAPVTVVVNGDPGTPAACANAGSTRPLVRWFYPGGGNSGNSDNANWTARFEGSTIRHELVVQGLNKPVKCDVSWEINLTNRPSGVSVESGGTERLWPGVRIELSAQRPTANAGANRTVVAGQTAILDGSQSLTDVGDLCCPAPDLSSLSYSWVQLDPGPGEQVAITGGTANFAAVSVSNLSQAGAGGANLEVGDVRSTTDLDYRVAQCFTTGTNGGAGFNLARIRARFADVRIFAGSSHPGPISAELWSGSGNVPVAALAGGALDADDDTPGRNQTIVFTPRISATAAAFHLRDDSTYCLLLSAANTPGSAREYYVVQQTASTSEDSGAGAGWSVADRAAVRRGGGLWSDTTAGAVAAQIEVTAVPVQGLASFVAPPVTALTQLRFRLTVVDNTNVSGNAGLSDTDDVTITVIPSAPVRTVDNLAESSATATSSDATERASAFVTGNNSGGYILNHVVVEYAGETKDDGVYIRAASGNRPGASLRGAAPLTRPAAFGGGTAPAAGFYTFTPSGNVVMAAATTYYVGVRGRFGTTNSGNQMSLGNWDIVNGLYRRSGGGWVSEDGTAVVRFRLSVTPVSTSLKMRLRVFLEGPLR